MSRLGKAVDEYLALRRGLGFDLLRTEGLLRQFVTFADEQGARSVTIELALRWAKLAPRVQQAECATRLGWSANSPNT